VILRAQNANLWVGSEGEERDGRIFQVALTQYNWVKIFKQFDPFWDATEFLQAAGKGFKAVKHFPRPAKLLEKVERQLAELGAKVPPVGPKAKFTNEDGEYEYYPKEHKDWWCTLVDYKQPNKCSWFENRFGLPTFPRELDFDDLAKKWEEGA